MSQQSQRGNCVAPSSQTISSIAASSASSLHPLLQTALENLDVQLEEELTRYRRQQRLQPETSRRKFSFASSKLLQQPAGLQLPQVAAPTPASPDETPLVPDHSPISIAPSIPIDPAAVDPAAPESPTAPSAEVAQLATLEAGLRIDSLQLPDAEPAAPEDYLASSEELLRSIAEEDPQQRVAQPDRLLDTLLTPLGIGSLLLLLLSTATLGYLVMNPTSLGFLSAQKPAADSPNAAPNAAPAQPSPVPGVIVAPSPNLAAKEFVELNLNTLSTLPKPSPTAPQKPSASPSPQAANRPLEPLIPPATNRSGTGSSGASSNELATVIVPPEPAVMAPAPAGNSRPAAPSPRRSASAPSQSSGQSSLRETAEQPTSPVAQPAVSAPAPAPASEPAPRAESPAPAVAANPSSGQSNYYYVVTPYRSDSDLNQVQEAVPDAYVRNFSDGASVQMGAFSDQSKAQERVQELQQQGIEAEVKAPE
ncbi:SPOR domain-containing protein [Leptolyngbya sp. GB1-A1]|uniref:SPOR domain-containing protein n=1 Tax=Leptolyngbya sp. GB1-A1 TaxID=2933908 RepID=UPI0032983389